MSNERIIRGMAGAFSLISLALSRLHSEYWLLFTVFVGFNLLQSSITGFCPPELLLRKIRGGKAPSAGSCCG